MALKEYVVVQDAVSTPTGELDRKGNPVVLRILNGVKIEADPKDPKIIALLEMRAVVPIDKYKPGMRVTPKIVLAALGAKDDPVAQPMKEMQPIKPDARTLAEHALD
jgi:hypothetical protein